MSGIEILLTIAGVWFFLLGIGIVSAYIILKVSKWLDGVIND